MYSTTDRDNTGVCRRTQLKSKTQVNEAIKYIKSNTLFWDHRQQQFNTEEQRKGNDSKFIKLRHYQILILQDYEQVL